MGPFGEPLDQPFPSPCPCWGSQPPSLLSLTPQHLPQTQIPAPFPLSLAPQELHHKSREALVASMTLAKFGSQGEGPVMMEREESPTLSQGGDSAAPERPRAPPAAGAPTAGQEQEQEKGSAARKGFGEVGAELILQREQLPQTSSQPRQQPGSTCTSLQGQQSQESSLLLHSQKHRPLQNPGV